MSVSVIIPHYNGEKFLPEAVKSVADQGALVKELIVVDDGSEEERWEKAMKACQVFTTESWYRHALNRGQGFALNRGVEVARAGEFLAFLDADDIWTPKKLAKQVAALKAESADACYGQALEFQHGGYTLGDPVPAPLLSGLCVRREVMRDLPFAEGIGAGMTIDWFARAEDARLKFVKLSDVLFYRRIHGENYGIRCREQALTEYMDALRTIEGRRKRGNTKP